MATPRSVKNLVSLFSNICSKCECPGCKIMLYWCVLHSNGSSCPDDHLSTNEIMACFWPAKLSKQASKHLHLHLATVESLFCNHDPLLAQVSLLLSTFGFILGATPYSSSHLQYVCRFRGLWRSWLDVVSSMCVGLRACWHSDVEKDMASWQRRTR